MTIRILFVEDSQDDVELQLRRLREAGFEPRWDRVQSQETLRVALADGAWQVALVDYNIPGFSGVEALRLIGECNPDLPAITVSGSIDEDTAVETMAAGAVDYVLKDNLTRLAPAVRRAVDGADLRRAHRQAAESAHLALLALDHASVAVVTVTEDGAIDYLNDYAARAFGGERGNLSGKKIWELDDAMPLDVAWQELWERLVSQGTAEFRIERRRSGGGRMVMDVTANYLEGVGLVIGYGRDVTGRVESEEALQAEQSNLAAIFEASPVAMLVCDQEANVVRVNRTTLRMAGFQGERLLKHRPDSKVQCGEVLACVNDWEAECGCGTSPECVHCPLRNAVLAAVDGVSLRGLEFALDVLSDGEVAEKWLRAGVEPMVMDGKPHVTVAIDDITDRRRATDALKASQERFLRFAEHIPGFVSIKDADRRYLYLSAPARSSLGDGEEAWLGKRPEDLWGPEDAAVSSAAARKALAGETVDEVVVGRKGQDTRYFRSLHFPISRGDALPLIGGLMVDVTEQVRAEEEVRRQAEQLRRTVEGAVLAMSQVVETRDPYTAGHERRVAELATAIGREMGMGDAELDGLRLGALIHDIGKISVPAEILAKPGRLSPIEFDLIKQHARAGYEILSVIDFGRPVAEMVLQHHERLDGSGYPEGLTGDDLLPESRILAVADVVEAMSSHRPYRAAQGLDAALAEIRGGAGTLYDAEVAAVCERVITKQGFQFSP